MGAQAKIGAFVRWLLTWPALVVFALNIENAISKAGYGTIIDQHWKDALPVLKDAYGATTSAWVLYPALIILGAVIYEWIRTLSNRMEADGSAYQLWLVRQQAESLSAAFRKEGVFRRLAKPSQEIPRLNNRLEKLNLPPIPTDFNEREQPNQVVSVYLLLLSKGHVDDALAFILNANPIASASRQSPQGTESETPL